MKINKPITLWDTINNAIVDLTDADEPLPNMSERQMVEKLVELAYHFRLESKRLAGELEELTWQ